MSGFRYWWRSRVIQLLMQHRSVDVALRYGYRRNWIRTHTEGPEGNVEVWLG